MDSPALWDRNHGSRLRQALADATLRPRKSRSRAGGGSTRVPLVRRTVQEFFSRTPHRGADPDESVALGAAVQADIHRRRRKYISAFLDVTRCLCIETMGGVVRKNYSRIRDSRERARKCLQRR